MSTSTIENDPTLNGRPLFHDPRHRKVRGYITAPGYFETVPSANVDTPAATTLTSAFLAIPDRAYVSGTLKDSQPVLIRKSDGQQLKTVEELVAISTQAVCGRGEETVLDTTVRNTKRIAPDEVGIQWARKEDISDSQHISKCQQNGLDEALDTVTSLLCEPNLTAELHDVLIYEPGSFFKEHKDSKKHPQHKMTLVVDCGTFAQHQHIPGSNQNTSTANDSSVKGGGVVFLNEQRPPEYRDWHFDNYWGVTEDYSYTNDKETMADAALVEAETKQLLDLQPDDHVSTSDDEYDMDEPLDLSCTDDDDMLATKQPSNRRVGYWKSKQKGDWCAWYTSQLHKVLPVTSGVRVVAVFNVLREELGHEDETAGGSPGTVIPACAPDWPNVHATSTSSSVVTAPGPLTQLPVELLVEVRSYLQGSRDICTIGLGCHRLRHLFNPLTAFQTEIEHSNLYEFVFGASCTVEKKLGFVLHHQYSCDGKAEVLLQHLRGRDAVLVSTVTEHLTRRHELATAAVPTNNTTSSPPASSTLVKLQLLPVDVIIEFPHENTGWYIHLVPDAKAWYLMARAEKRRSEDEAQFHIQTEIDSFYPVASDKRLANEKDIVWGSTTPYVTSFVNTHIRENEFTELWGNHAVFSIYWYRSCVALWEIVP